MTKKFKIFVIAAGILGATALLGNYAALYSNNNNGSGESISQQIRIFSDAFMIIKDNYVEEISPKKLIYGALKGMIGALDNYSQFMEPDIAERVKSDTEGEFGGLGIRITSQDNYITVITPIKDTPAYEMGIFPGDQIVEIEGKSAKDISLREAVNKLRGEPGTDVTISIAREGEEGLLKFTITRDIIVPRKVYSEIIRDDIGYLRLVEFTGDAPEALKEAIENFKEKGIGGGLILDLRNNPGGLLSSAIDVANLFIQKGELIVYTEGRRADQNRKFYAAKKAILPDIPLAILVNKGSASGSEIVAGSIKDLKRGIIIGETTFGKGSVQSIIDLADGSSLRLTTAKYYTPSGVVIHGSGVEPNIEVSISKETRIQLAKQRQIIYDRRKKVEEDSGDEQIVDPQLQRAIDILVARKIFFDK
ncbi:MAG: S41 family peptidase [Elusimicrobiota bacterium]|nr:S41 family peptidase [Elusimicrobiota bacterium]